MSLDTVPVTGGPVLPDGSLVPGGKLLWSLSGVDTEGAAIVVPRAIEWDLDEAGLIPAGKEVWRNTAGLRGTFYRLYLSDAVPNDATRRRPPVYLGTVQVGDAASYTLAELLNNPVPDVQSWNINLDPVEYAAFEARMAATLDAVDILESRAAREPFTFPITYANGGRGPYPLDFDPGSATAITLTVDGAPLLPTFGFVLSDMPSAPGGKGILFTADQVEDAVVQGIYWKALGYAVADNAALDYASMSALQDAITAGLALPDGRTVTAGGVALVAKTGAAVSGIPAGFLPANWVFTRAEIETATGAVAPGLNVILVLETGYAVPYVREALATDLIGGDASRWRKAGFDFTDAAGVATEIANGILMALPTGDIFVPWGGEANAIVLTSGKNWATVPAGAKLRFRAGAANTGATTIAVDGLAAKPAVTVTGAALPAGYIRTDIDTTATYDGTSFVVDRQPEYSGTDSAGFEKFADGSARAWKVLTGLGPVNSAAGSLYASSGIAIGALPMTFAAVPRRRVQGFHASQACWVQQTSAPTVSDGGKFQLLKTGSTAATDFGADCLFEGRWY